MHLLKSSSSIKEMNKFFTIIALFSAYILFHSYFEKNMHIPYNTNFQTQFHSNFCHPITKNIDYCVQVIFHVARVNSIFDRKCFNFSPLILYAIASSHQLTIIMGYSFSHHFLVVDYQDNNCH